MRRQLFCSGIGATHEYLKASRARPFQTVGQIQFHPLLIYELAQLSRHPQCWDVLRTSATVVWNTGWLSYWFPSAVTTGRTGDRPGI